MAPEANPSDPVLLRRAAGGDEDAFTLLYRRRQQGIYRFALEMTGSAAIAEEITQEVFLALIRKAKDYDPVRGSVAAYLFGMARNFVARSLERTGPQPAVLNDEAAEAAAADDALGDLTRRESIERVREAVMSLPPKYREAVVLCDLREQSYAETASALGCTVGTVRSRLHRARALLLRKLRPRAKKPVEEGCRA